jgi:hypothetical protein
LHVHRRFFVLFYRYDSTGIAAGSTPRRFHDVLIAKYNRSAGMNDVPIPGSSGRRSAGAAQADGEFRGGDGRPGHRRDRDKTDAGKHAGRLSEALRGHEKDVQHKNVSRIKDFQAFFGETKKREAKLVADADTGNLQTTSLSYGRVLEACVSCHKRYRD